MEPFPTQVEVESMLCDMPNALRKHRCVFDLSGTYDGVAFRVFLVRSLRPMRAKKIDYDGVGISRKIHFSVYLQKYPERFQIIILANIGRKK